jgi:hypothetical protein
MRYLRACLIFGMVPATLSSRSGITEGMNL